MQRPFQVTKEMQQELENEIAGLTENVKDAHDAVGDRSGASIIPRRELRMDNLPSPPSVPKDDPPRAALLETRQTTHGSFRDNAALSQAIKTILRAAPGWGSLTTVEREVMDMIALKFSRVLSGRSLERQHWEDVVGYAQLALEQCEP